VGYGPNADFHRGDFMTGSMVYIKSENEAAFEVIAKFAFDDAVKVLDSCINDDGSAQFYRWSPMELRDRVTSWMMTMVAHPDQTRISAGGVEVRREPWGAFLIHLMIGPRAEVKYTTGTGKT